MGAVAAPPDTVGTLNDAVRILTNLATAGEITVPQYNGGLLKLAARAMAAGEEGLALGWVSSLSTTYLDQMPEQAFGDEVLTRAAETLAEFLVSKGLADRLVGPDADILPGITPARA